MGCHGYQNVGLKNGASLTFQNSSHTWTYLAYQDLVIRDFVLRMFVNINSHLDIC